MSFKSDIQSTEDLEHAWQDGIQALEPTDRAKLQIARTRDLCGGAAIDTTLKSKYPSENRWDYVVGMRDGKDEVAHFIEVHPARNSSHIHEVEAKADWLLAWLKTTSLNHRTRRLHWIATEGVSFTQRDLKLKALALKGVVLRGSKYQLE